MSIVHLLIVNLNCACAQVWTLDNCIDTALQNNLKLKSGLINSQIASVNLKNSKQNLLPSLNAGVTHGYNWGQTIDLFTNQFATNRVMFDNFYLSSSVVLFSGLQNFYSIKVNNIAVQESILEQEIFQRNIKIDVSATFLQVLLNKEVVELAKDNFLKTELQYKRIHELVSARQATQFELSEIDAQKQLDNYTITKAENDLRYSKLLLQQLLNISISDSFDIPTSLDSSYRDEDSLVQTILADAAIYTLPEIVKIELGIQKQMYLIKSLKGRYYPSILVSGSVGSGYSGNNKMLNANGDYVPRPFGEQFNNNLYQSLSFSLSIPIFNKNATRNQLKIKELELQSLFINKQNEYNQLKQKIEQLSMDILNTSSQIEALEKVYSSALLNCENFQVRYETGNATYTQLIEVKNKLFQAKSELIQAKYQLLFKQTVLGFYY
ncbi:MAG: TolC family protein [Crocinitomicaceae bacterium]|nr:TolC family protein [Crocinitomicaceae bacterium]